MKPRIAKNIARLVPKVRAGMDAKHLAKIRLCPCSACGRTSSDMAAIEAHHLLRTEERGLSRKSSDRWAIPLCWRCHRALHDNGDEEAYLMGRGIDGRALASALWAVRGDGIEANRRVIDAHRQRAALKLRSPP